MSDEDLVVEIREVLRTSEFLGEGHRTVRARLRTKGIRVGKNRVLRPMRENGLAPVRRGKHARGDRSHSGRITTDAPDELWGTNATRFQAKEDGWCGSSLRWITVSRRWSGGPWRRRETAGSPGARFIRTLKEERLYLHDFQSLEEAREVIGAFIARYNHGWLMERHGYRPE